MLLDQEDVDLIHKGTNCLIALGSNQQWEGDTPTDLILRSISELSEHDLRVTAVSRLFRTPCFPKGTGADFVNAAVMIKTSLMPVQLLSELHNLEARAGRVRKIRWGSRTLDIDLLSYGDLILPDIGTFYSWHDLALSLQPKRTPRQLILPHPRMQERAFVLGPLMDIAPNWNHPVLGKTVAEMFQALTDKDRQELRVIAL